jgi:hypothetical protein
MTLTPYMQLNKGLDQGDAADPGCGAVWPQMSACHGQNVTAPDGCLRHTDQLSR